MTKYVPPLKKIYDPKAGMKSSADSPRPNLAIKNGGGLLKKFAFLFLVSSIVGACGRFEVLGIKKGTQQSNAACAQKLAGVWEFGRAPFGCAMAEATGFSLMRTYTAVVYNETQVSDAETKRFVTEMHSYISDYSVAYMKRREPSATADDIETWRQLILTTAHQESYWTQYRYGKDSVFRFFRGDNGHGYGMMQIDDRWHQDFIKSEKVYDFESHILYALDMLYDARAAVLKKPCGTATSGAGLNRSIYSRYNGGPASQCRWQTLNSKWSRNDRGFNEKLTAKAWEKSL